MPHGTHGSLSKAGKVKWNGNIPHLLDKPDKPKPKHLSPRLANKKKYEKREELKQKIGQRWKRYDY